MASDAESGLATRFKGDDSRHRYDNWSKPLTSDSISGRSNSDRIVNNNRSVHMPQNQSQKMSQEDMNHQRNLSDTMQYGSFDRSYLIGQSEELHVPKQGTISDFRISESSSYMGVAPLFPPRIPNSAPPTLRIVNESMPIPDAIFSNGSNISMSTNQPGFDQTSFKNGQINGYLIEKVDEWSPFKAGPLSPHREQIPSSHNFELKKEDFTMEPSHFFSLPGQNVPVLNVQPPSMPMHTYPLPCEKPANAIHPNGGNVHVSGGPLPPVPPFFPQQIPPWRRTFGALGAVPPGHPMINETAIAAPPLISMMELTVMPLAQCRELEMHIRMYQQQLDRLRFFASQHSEQLLYLQNRLREVGTNDLATKNNSNNNTNSVMAHPDSNLSVTNRSLSTNGGPVQDNRDFPSTENLNLSANLNSGTRLKSNINLPVEDESSGPMFELSDSNIGTRERAPLLLEYSPEGEQSGQEPMADYVSNQVDEKLSNRQLSIELHRILNVDIRDFSSSEEHSELIHKNMESPPYVKNQETAQPNSYSPVEPPSLIFEQDKEGKMVENMECPVVELVEDLENTVAALEKIKLESSIIAKGPDESDQMERKSFEGTVDESEEEREELSNNSILKGHKESTAAVVKSHEELSRGPDPRRNKLYRIGSLLIEGHHTNLNASHLLSNGETIDVSLPPHSNIFVVCDLPTEITRSRKVFVGLFREGALLSKPAIIAKRVSNFSSQNGHRSRGRLPFFAPRNVGTFVFRAYDESQPTLILATSPRWNVDVNGKEAETALKSTHTLLIPSKEGKEARGALSACFQLTHILGRLRKFPALRNSENMRNLTIKVVDSAWDQVIAVGTPTTEGGTEDPHIRAVHGAVWALLKAIFSNQNLMDIMLEQKSESQEENPNPLDQMRARLDLWCSIEQRFYTSKEELVSHFSEEIGFFPSYMKLSELADSSILSVLNREISDLARKLSPSENFYNKREALRSHLEDIIVTKRGVPQVPCGTVLRVFGSSANCFGLESSDLDMCLMYPQGSDPIENSSIVIDAVAAQLSNLGMLDVDCRPTARIPIVLFKDPKSGLNCDISVVNPLAVRNTDLLKVYALADPRVRPLAYVIKHWAKQRRINSPSEGTLSSYGYILCLLHFLQVRNPPVIPNLQALPPNWPGLPAPASIRPHSGLPQHITSYGSDGQTCNTYFYVPPKNSTILQNFGASNTESLAELLAGFFRYFALEFDTWQSVVSIRTGGTVLKEVKSEADGWAVHTRLSIEDPFESWYDVAHVLKWSRHKHIHTEFMRAFTALCDAAKTFKRGTLPDLLGTVCQYATPPSFLRIGPLSSKSIPNRDEMEGPVDSSSETKGKQ